MLALIGFLIMLGPLVIVHELGHYLFARLFNVKAEAFSVGFGPVLWKRMMGETELRISAIPLGGYVKLLGEDREAELTPELQARALHRQPPWKRFFIFFGGPFFNFLFAIVIFMTMLVVGEPRVASVVGRVVPNTPAAQAGFESGDKILAIDGKPVQSFDDVLNIVGDNPGKKLSFDVKHRRSEQTVTLSAVPSSEDGFTLYGENAAVGSIDGMFASPRGTVAGVSDPSSPAAKAGLRTRDQILEINGTPLKSWEELEQFYASAADGASLRLKVQPAEKDKPATEVILEKPAGRTMAEGWGLYSSELFVEQVKEDAPANKAGLRSGDRLVAVGDEEVRSFYGLREAIQRSGEKTGKVLLKWEREGKLLSEEIAPTATAQRDPVLKKTTTYTVGITPMLVPGEPATYIERIWNPFKLLYVGTERMVTFTWRNFVAIGKMFTGDVSVATLGGPIMIGKIAGESLARGLITFLGTMAILSIGLGVLNILPIPVLDGGHLLLLAIESIRGKPLTMRAMEIIQLVGLSLVLLLMAVVIRNDVARLMVF